MASRADTQTHTHADVRTKAILRNQAHAAEQGQISRHIPEMKDGDIVVLRDDLITWIWWKLARIIELLKERYGNIQVSSK